MHVRIRHDAGTFLQTERKSTPRNAAESQRTPILSDLPEIGLHWMGPQSTSDASKLR